MNRVLMTGVMCVALLVALQGAAFSAAPATQPAVAILEFEANVPGNADLGKQIGETLTALLAGEGGFTLVERASLDRTIKEHELNLTGLVDTPQAIKIGKLVGAKILVTGRAFAMDKSLFITAKLIGTETSLVEGVVVKGKVGADTGDLVNELSQKVAARLREAGPKLLAGDDPADPMPELKKKLATLQLPKMTLAITEQHLGQQRAIDPPVETELRMMLSDVGVTVIDTQEVDQAKAGATLTIKGEAISEFAARIGNLVSCTARVEIKIVDLASGKVIYTDRTTTRAADLSENIAAKTALQKAAHEMGLKILDHFAKTMPSAQGAEKK